MSKMSQIHAELTEAAAELGFESIEDAEAHGYKVEYNENYASLVPDIDKAYKLEEEEMKRLENAKKLEIVWRTLNNALDIIALVYKPDNKMYSTPAEDITDEKVNEYYYKINSMCVELSERKSMLWQQEDK